MDHYLRFGIGCERDVLTQGLQLFDEFVSKSA
jgi:hypothetical protein